MRQIRNERAIDVLALKSGWTKEGLTVSYFGGVAHASWADDGDFGHWVKDHQPPLCDVPGGDKARGKSGNGAAKDFKPERCAIILLRHF